MRSCNPQGVLPSDITALAVGSYPTFSPLPASQSRHRRLFSVTLLHPHGHRAVNSCGALCCSDFPLPDSQAAIERTCKFFVHDAAEHVPDGIVTTCISYYLLVISNNNYPPLKSYNLSYFTPPQGWCFLLAARQSV